MPEGHTIHRLALDHSRSLRGQTLAVSSPQGRFVGGAALVDGRTLEGIDAWGKHLFYRFDNGQQVHVHLGLFGKWWRFASPAPATHHQVRMRLEGERIGFDLTGPTACEVLDSTEAKRITDRLGPDPIRSDADEGRVWPKLQRRASPIGVALMDQSMVAGVGNVYRAESLFVHRVHPERPCNTLGADEWAALWATLVHMLRAGVKARRIVTVDPRDPCVDDGRTRYVYKQLHCANCGSAIRRWDLAGRWAYACERCQPPWAARPAPRGGLPGPVGRTGAG